MARYGYGKSESMETGSGRDLLELLRMTGRRECICGSVLSLSVVAEGTDGGSTSAAWYWYRRISAVRLLAKGFMLVRRTTASAGENYDFAWHP